MQICKQDFLVTTENVQAVFIVDEVIKIMAHVLVISSYEMNPTSLCKHNSILDLFSHSVFFQHTVTCRILMIEFIFFRSFKALMPKFVILKGVP